MRVQPTGTGIVSRSETKCVPLTDACYSRVSVVHAESVMVSNWPGARICRRTEKLPFHS